MGLLTGKTALITGGSRGIGEALVKAMAAEGADIAFTYHSSEESAMRVVTEASAGGQKIKAYKSDAANYDQAEQLVKDVVAEFERIDILINNAGITKDTLMLRMGEEQWDKVLDVGVFGNAGQANYAASKAGIIGFSKSIAKEVGSRGIRCNAVAPGFIETDMTHALTEEQQKGYIENIPLKRLGTGQDIADTCIFLGSDMSKYVTGQVISVCGGLNT